MPIAAVRFVVSAGSKTSVVGPPRLEKEGTLAGGEGAVHLTADTVEVAQAETGQAAGSLDPDRAGEAGLESGLYSAEADGAFRRKVWPRRFDLVVRN